MFQLFSFFTCKTIGKKKIIETLFLSAHFNFSDSEIITEKVGGHVNDLIWLNYDSILKLVPVNLLHGQPQGQDDLSI